MSLALFGTVMKSHFREQEGFTINTDLRTSLEGGHLDVSYQDERGQTVHAAEASGSWSGEAYQLHFLGDRLRIAYNDYTINPDNQLSLRKRDNFLLGSLKLTGEKRGEFSLQGTEETPGVQDILLSIHNLHLEDYRSLGLPTSVGFSSATSTTSVRATSASSRRSRATSPSATYATRTRSSATSPPPSSTSHVAVTPTTSQGRSATTVSLR